jgi:hypothetical protein
MLGLATAPACIASRGSFAQTKVSCSAPARPGPQQQSRHAVVTPVCMGRKAGLPLHALPGRVTRWVTRIILAVASLHSQGV